ncbi:unnamed protein product [Prorocentrum cordatum]|uniref:Methyltransferase type 11 domain-containing protein n=1 Tax=Prorocentrum cordatum TaxID=2364126 RepID=A0ABN9T9G1_9DINO|nr:unnamed protein product [Polarella glacialis]
MMRGKDVLEVACARGGGARYLAEVAGPRSYVATDYLESNLEICRRTHSPLENLEFRLVDASEIGDIFPAASFDFVLCVQAVTHFQDARKFVFGASQVLRPGGGLLMCDTFQRDKLQASPLRRGVRAGGRRDGRHQPSGARRGPLPHAVGSPRPRGAAGAAAAAARPQACRTSASC